MKDTDGGGALKTQNTRQHRANTRRHYLLRVFVAGQTPKSELAILNLTKICEKELPGQYKIEVVDVSKNPKLAIENSVVALPAVIRTLPEPVRKLVGICADETTAVKVLAPTPLKAA
jgi:circadian clock protein KaiB